MRRGDGGGGGDNMWDGFFRRDTRGWGSLHITEEREGGWAGCMGAMLGVRGSVGTINLRIRGGGINALPSK
jgi:hypothetical protein